MEAALPAHYRSRLVAGLGEGMGRGCSWLSKQSLSEIRSTVDVTALGGRELVWREIKGLRAGLSDSMVGESGMAEIDKGAETLCLHGPGANLELAEIFLGEREDGSDDGPLPAGAARWPKLDGRGRAE